MLVNKNVNCKSLEELIETVKKLQKRAKIVSFNFNGNINKKDKTEYFSATWQEEEEV